MLELYLRWQLKYLRVATRFGLLAEACLALLLLPILRGLALFRLLGIQFEASVRYHIWLGTAMISFAFVHGASTLFIWGVSHHIQDEVIHSFSFVLCQCKNMSTLCFFVFVFESSFSFVLCLRPDREMAKNGQDILGWGGYSSYRISNLDNSTSSNKEEKV